MSDIISPFASPADPRPSRRSFLKLAGLGGAVIVAAGCDSDDPDPDPAAVVLDFSDAFGVLNYAYALEQLEAAFYTQVINDPYDGITDDERSVLTDLRDHEIAHREFFRAKIPQLGGTAIPGLTPDFSTIDFTSRASVLTTARTFEDLGVGAYNGVAARVEMVNPLVNAGEIVSVEARHAAAIRDLLDPLSFAPNAFDPAIEPADVLAAAQPFIMTTITTRGL